jgi:hypothetical protein
VQEWEYLEIYLAGRHWADSTGATGEVDEVQVGGYSHANTNDLLDDLGAVGWELVAALAGSSGGSSKLFLKRPLMDEADDEGDEDEG